MKVSYCTHSPINVQTKPPGLGYLKFRAVRARDEKGLLEIHPLKGLGGAPHKRYRRLSFDSMVTGEKVVCFFFSKRLARNTAIGFYQWRPLLLLLVGPPWLPGGNRGVIFYVNYRCEPVISEDRGRPVGRSVGRRGQIDKKDARGEGGGRGRRAHLARYCCSYASRGGGPFKHSGRRARGVNQRI